MLRLEDALDLIDRADLRSLPERFTAKVEVNVASGCWIWTGELVRGSGAPNGYGRYSPGSGQRRVMAYRFSYEAVVGPIPDGLEIDHRCRNTRCVNPDHVEPVTHLVNMRRGRLHTQTHCHRDHEMTEENTYRWGPEKGWRTCRACVRMGAERKAERRKARQKEAAA